MSSGPEAWQRDRGYHSSRGTMTARIPLTRGLVAIVDEADLTLVEGRRWCAHLKRRTIYAVCREAGRKIRMHRVILGVPPGIEVDHINGDGLDNRRCNLRMANRLENTRNRRLDADNTTGFKGIRLKPDTPRARPWEARIPINGRRVSLGHFATAEEAARAYDNAALRFFGEFARTNKMIGLL